MLTLTKFTPCYLICLAISLVLTFLTSEKVSNRVIWNLGRILLRVGIVDGIIIRGWPHLFFRNFDLFWLAICSYRNHHHQQFPYHWHHPAFVHFGCLFLLRSSMLTSRSISAVASLTFWAIFKLTYYFSCLVWLGLPFAFNLPGNRTVLTFYRCLHVSCNKFYIWALRYRMHCFHLNKHNHNFYSLLRCYSCPQYE